MKATCQSEKCTNKYDLDVCLVCHKTMCNAHTLVWKLPMGKSDHLTMASCSRRACMLEAIKRCMMWNDMVSVPSDEERAA